MDFSTPIEAQTRIVTSPSTDVGNLGDGFIPENLRYFFWFSGWREDIKKELWEILKSILY